MEKKSTTDKKKNKSMTLYWIIGISLVIAFITTINNIGQGLVRRDFLIMTMEFAGAFTAIFIFINIIWWVSTKIKSY